MNLRWLLKATGTTDDYNPDVTGGSGGYLSPEQVRQFLRQAIEASALLSDVRIETSINPKFEIPRISLNSRILRPGVQATRVTEPNRQVPAYGLMSLSTVLFKGEVPVSDEYFEDSIEKAALADTIMTMIAEAVGRDVEELVIKSDTARDPTGTDVAQADSAIFDTFDGMVKRAVATFGASRKLDASGYTSYEELFARMIEAMMPRYRRNYPSLRFYVPTLVKDRYHESLSARGTQLGDRATTDNLPGLQYRGIPIVAIPLLSGTDTVNGTAIDYSQYCFLTDPQNLVVGFQRRIRIEKWRDPREGATSFLPTVRFDADWANPEASVMASGVNIP